MDQYYHHLSSNRFKVHQASGYGPTFELQGGVDILAPGTNMVVVAARKGSSLSEYGVHTGTSFANPYVTSILAAYIGSLGGKEKLGMKGMLMAREKLVTCGVPVSLPAHVYLANPKLDKSIQSPATVQGSGLVNVRNLLSPAHVSPASIDLADTEHFTATHTLIFTNTGTTSVTVTIGIEHGAGYYAFNRSGGSSSVAPEGLIQSMIWAVEYVPELQAGFEINPTPILVEPGVSHDFIVVFKQPIRPRIPGGELGGVAASVGRAWDAIRRPIFTGWVVFSANDGSTQRVRYVGAASNQRELQIYKSAPIIRFHEGPANFLVYKPFQISLSGFAPIPTLTVFVLLGTRQAIFDFVPKGADRRTLDPAVFRLAYLQKNTEGIHRFVEGKSVGFDNTLIRRLPITGFNQAGKRVVDPGVTYIPRVRLLSISGDPKKWEDWQPWYGPEVTIYW
ncbi:hypothetical protein BJ508DRAFT_307519 [Ascobolus immersus RN42]|uniref:Uncharacterized protein n=1 Tax=Ascobolus immersus RN42 TaxID=1160509 RepID=A0A3N4I4J6_ASCIM|nr:hypothetical protein BJ508DRAFT_307519 [Ascobolus immersus RN42]